MGGNFEEAVRATSRILAVRGQIVPSTTADVTLGAKFDDGEVVWGESEISHQGKRIEQLYIRPEHAHAYPEAVDAIRQADMIVIGPGSLYTSVLPNLLVRDIRDAIRVSRAVKVYVANVATQHGETDGFSVADHVRAIERHVGRGLIDYVLANSNVAERLAGGVAPSRGQRDRRHDPPGPARPKMSSEDNATTTTRTNLPPPWCGFTMIEKQRAASLALPLS